MLGAVFRIYIHIDENTAYIHVQLFREDLRHGSFHARADFRAAAVQVGASVCVEGDKNARCGVGRRIGGFPETGYSFRDDLFPVTSALLPFRPTHEGIEFFNAGFEAAEITLGHLHLCGRKIARD
ncbi:hypothetical protein SDC9_53984 [bioreactor metagenome]|uniref:Uncharacterized protein n=1 Tax=bioreactor metagenome TaxID=1076179 RepID=A0A644WVG7_9ZZZZ